MPYVCYKSKKFNAEHTQIIERADEICNEYAEAGMDLTLRALYYRFVSRNWIANKQTEYDRLGEILNNARLAGLLDWDHLVDRTRNRVDQPHWDGPAAIIKGATNSYKTDLWKGQHERVVVWVEKDAAVGTIEPVCKELDVPFFSCRGYTSQSEMWAAAQRIQHDIENGDRVTILHIGDHDPSGVDMTRDIDDRLRMFIVRNWLNTWGRNGISGQLTVGAIKQHMREHMRNVEVDPNDKITDGQSPWRVKRIALNLDQIEQYAPPPNPVKKTDGRWRRYFEEYGIEESWELDALEPRVLQDLIRSEVVAIRDETKWDAAVEESEQDTMLLQATSDRWDEVAALVDPFKNKGGKR